MKPDRVTPLKEIDLDKDQKGLFDNPKNEDTQLTVLSLSHSSHYPWAIINNQCRIVLTTVIVVSLYLLLTMRGYIVF